MPLFSQGEFVDRGVGCLEDHPSSPKQARLLQKCQIICKRSSVFKGSAPFQEHQGSQR